MLCKIVINFLILTKAGVVNPPLKARREIKYF
jgi:hypothetical protein